MAVTGAVSQPGLRYPGYTLDADGVGTVLPGMAGVVYNVSVGDAAFGWAADHVEPGMLALHLVERRAQELDRDVDRDVALRLQHRKQADRLGAVAGAEVDQDRAAAEGGAQLGHLKLEEVAMTAA